MDLEYPSPDQQAHQLAASMQLSAPEVGDFTRESSAHASALRQRTKGPRKLFGEHHCSWHVGWPNGVFASTQICDAGGVQRKAGMPMET